MIKCIITDIDQTLTDAEMKLTSRTLEVAGKARAQGIQIVLCSGRPFPGMRDYLEALGLNQRAYCSVGFNGGVLYENGTGTVLRAAFFEPETLREIVAELRRVNVNFRLESPSSIVTGLNPVKHYTVRDSFITNMPLEDVYKRQINTFGLLILGTHRMIGTTAGIRLGAGGEHQDIGALFHCRAHRA